MLKNLLATRRAAIVGRWRRGILEGYPDDAARFLEQERDPFLNPVGSALARETEAAYDAVVGDTDRDRLSAALVTLVRIRAVQQFSPSEAVGFVFLLKQAVREELRGEAASPEVAFGLQELESRIDGAALLAFDLYTGCREQIHELRVREVNRRTAGLVPDRRRLRL